MRVCSFFKHTCTYQYVLSNREEVEGLFAERGEQTWFQRCLLGVYARKSVNLKDSEMQEMSHMSLSDRSRCDRGSILSSLLNYAGTTVRFAVSDYLSVFVPSTKLIPTDVRVIPLTRRHYSDPYQHQTGSMRSRAIFYFNTFCINGSLGDLRPMT